MQRDKNTGNKIKILIVDDHAVVRRGLKQIVAETSDLEVAGEAASGKEALEMVRKFDLDLILLDIAMPDQSGFDVLIKLHDEYPDIPVLILSMYPEEYHELRMLRAGASGYLTKESAPEELVNAIRNVFKGEKILSPHLAKKLVFEIGKESEKPPHEELTDREFQVLCKMAQGKTVTEIGEELSLSVKTISTHRANLLRKMNMHSNAQLTHYAIKNGLVE